MTAKPTTGRRFGSLAAVALVGAGGALVGTQRDSLDGRRERGEALAALAARVDAREGEASRLERSVADLASALAASRGERARLAAEVDELRAGQLARSVEAAAVESRSTLALELALRAERETRVPDSELVRRELVAPTVRLNAKSEVGSGTLVYSRKRKGTPRTFVLTAWHIVKDNATGEGAPSPIEVDVYDEGPKPREEKGRVVARNEALDLALVEVDSERSFPTARLPRAQALERAAIFSRVYAIGCPLGYAPLPTSGEITSRQKELDGLVYWMVSAPTIFGNSGGGIYLAETRQLVGILSRISAYKSLIDVAVPHMGLVTPIDQVYDWLDSTEFAFIHKESTGEGAVLEASQPR